MEFPDLPALVRICRDHGVRPHWTTPGARAWPSTLSAGRRSRCGRGHASPDQIPLGRRRCADGVGHHDVNEDLHCDWRLTHMRLGLGVGANDVELLLRSLPSVGPALCRPRCHRPHAWQQWWAGKRPESGRCAAPGIAHIAGPCQLGRLVHASGGLCSRWCSMSATACASGRLRRRTAALQDRLFLGRAGQPGGALRPAFDARPQPAWRGTLVRFSVGLEAAGDLVADCEQALG
jgi:cysteine-S-conjugate beta-lyase